VRDTMSNQNEDIEKLKKLILETARDVAYLLDRCPDPNPGQMGARFNTPTRESAQASFV
jgi:hypothetical protein